MNIPKRIASAVINALKGGVVPRVGLGYIAVGRTDEINALLHDVSIAEEGGAFFRFVVGKYGSGKSFLMQIMRTHVMERGFAAMDADLSPERRLCGTKGQGLACYRELLSSLAVKAKPDGGALQLILEKWIDDVKQEVIREKNMTPSNTFFDVEVERLIYARIGELKNLSHGFDFATALCEFYNGHQQMDDARRDSALKWLRGEYQSKLDARRDNVRFSSVITDENWYDYLKVMAAFLKSSGYKGLVVMIDELVNIMKISNSVTRQNNYEKLLMMYNDIMQGRTSYMGIIMGSTPQCMEDTRRGVFSYEALRSRLERGRFATDETHDMLAPIIRLNPLTYEELVVLTEKLTEIHSGLYGYTPRIALEDRVEFVKIELTRVGARENITPREIIRDYIELMNMAYQNPEKTLSELMGSVTSDNNDSSDGSDNSGNSGGDYSLEFEDFDI